MKYAYLHRNFKRLNFEQRVVFGAQLMTVLACFFPWFSAAPVYGNPFYYNAFAGPIFLIGALVFVISLAVIFLFLDILFEKKRIKLPFFEGWVYLVAGAENLLLLLLALSVLLSVGQDYETSHVVFWIYVAMVAQIASLVATYLHFQLQEKQKVRDFFQHPDIDK